MNARATFHRIETDGWAVVQEWLEEPAEEGVQLDFKRGLLGKKGLHEATQSALSKALSAFANTEGGLLVFGVDTEKAANGVDVASKLCAVRDLERFVGEVKKRLPASVEPDVPGVHVAAVPKPDGTDEGVLVVFIPQGNGGPHRARGCKSENTDRYYVRTDDRFGVMAHPLLAAMFGQRPPAVLRLHVERTSPNQIVLHLVNEGRGVARDLLVRIRPVGSAGAVFMSGGFGKHWDHGRCNQADSRECGMEMAGCLYPEDRCLVRVLGLHPNYDWTQGSIEGRIDCDGAQPVHFAGAIPTLNETIALPAREEP